MQAKIRQSRGFTYNGRILHDAFTRPPYRDAGPVHGIVVPGRLDATPLRRQGNAYLTQSATTPTIRVHFS
jgi:hypothetical protein